MSKIRKNSYKEGVSNYSINLLWDNKVKKESQKYIHVAKTEEQLTGKFLMPAIK